MEQVRCSDAYSQATCSDEANILAFIDLRYSTLHPSDGQKFRQLQ